MTKLDIHINDYKGDTKLKEKYEKFFELMLELLAYGEEKYKEDSFQQLVIKDDFQRTERLSSVQLFIHSVAHGQEYLKNIPHDKFNDWEHQLAAIAVNPLIEYVIRSFENEKK